jgi:ornithine carbamoyltransferase
MKHFLKIKDLTNNELAELIDLSIKLKKELKSGVPHKVLQDKTLAMIFAKSSTRTRVSFETGMTQLGGHAIFLSTNDLQLGRGESIADTARTLSRYVDIIMIRTFKQEDVEELAQNATVPVINGLTDYAHPTQIVADLVTVKEHKGDLKGLKLCYVGDGNNVANSLIVGGIKSGMAVSLACPKGYFPDKEIMQWAKDNGSFEITDDTAKAAKDADVVYTDVWASMGQEAEAQKRKEIFKNYQVNEKFLSVCKKDVMVLHCLPAHKGEEISEETFEKHANYIFDEAENRMHAHKAIMLKCLEK